MNAVNNRYDNLDYMRGLCALSIMAYHYLSWVLGQMDASTFLGKMRVYGVSMFYVLSGLTMYLVYFKNFELTGDFFKKFYFRRFFRIFPLMWMVMIVNALLIGFKLSFVQVLINYTGLFGIIQWQAPLPTGVWSIGNELSFYLMLPILFFCIKQGKLLTALVSLVLFGVYIYFAFFEFDPNINVAYQEYAYKNPLNQAALFLSGILIGHIFIDKTISNSISIGLLLFGIVAFTFYPTTGDAISLVSGVNRIVYTALSLIVTIGFFKSDLSFIPTFIRTKLSWLGEISYSLYLLHPIIFSLVVFTGLKIRFVLPLAILFTFLLSWATYRFIETPARDLGFRLSKRKKE